MKNRLIITVSDIQGTKSYNIHQFVKKFLLILGVVIFILLSAGFWFISSLREDIAKVRKEKETQLKILTQKEGKLLAQNQMYSMQIRDKIKDIEELSSKLDDINDIIGVGENATKEEITQKTLEAIDLNKKKYTLQIIPNGSPLKIKYRVSSRFGYRINPITKRKQFHRGLDMAVPMKTPIYATADGIVSRAQARNIGDYGRVVSISHNFGFSTTFAHMNKVFVKIGDIVKKGQRIGLSGNSGRSSGAHLHYEVRFANQVLSPRNFIGWNLENYDKIFKKERRVKWESLIKMINEQHKMGQLL